MDKIICSVLILTSACCWCEKYVFVEDPEKTWAEARKHCKKHYIDLLPLTNKEEENFFKECWNDHWKEGWIGMYWNAKKNAWIWSGGDLVTYDGNLDLSDKDDHSKNVLWTKEKWDWEDGEDNHNFFCLNMRVVQEKKTWEDALEFCREQHTDLTSLLSVTENRLAKIKIQSADFTEQVWISLRYLGDTWLWVNGDPLSYEAWQQDGDLDHQCPMLKRCGALTKNGVWEGRDCQEKLSFICSRVIQQN